MYSLITFHNQQVYRVTLFSFTWKIGPLTLQSVNSLNTQRVTQLVKQEAAGKVLQRVSDKDSDFTRWHAQNALVVNYADDINGQQRITSPAHC